MQGWIEGMQRSIDYIEENLTRSPEIGEIAAQAGLSPFYYQRVFGALCGMTVGEYIRARRMTLAAQALSAGNARVIDVALQYGYDSPDSFARAFQRFHRVTPSRAREPGVSLRAMAPLRMKITLEGGNMLDYRITEKAPFTVVGVRRRFNSDDSYQEIPKFWAEWARQPRRTPPLGVFGVCRDMDGKDFDYWIADNYVPWEPLPEGCQTCTFPAGLWAEFRCKGPLPEALQRVNTQIWTEWLPALKGYALAGNYNLEVYDAPAPNPEDTLSYIWIPLVRTEGD